MSSFLQLACVAFTLAAAPLGRFAAHGTANAADGQTSRYGNHSALKSDTRNLEKRGLAFYIPRPLRGPRA
jgi:hypothetical protein